jgi:hypothetical protein
MKIFCRGKPAALLYRGTSTVTPAATTTIRLRQIGMRQRREFDDELGDFSPGDGAAARGEPGNKIIQPK